jgi:glucose/arabinose dehydrogenase
MRFLPALTILLFLIPVSAAAQLRAQVVASNFSAPVQMVRDPEVLDVIYIVEQGGVVQVLRNGLRLEPFIDLRAAISAGGERGLLGMAFDPNISSRRVFFNFTDLNGHTVVARFTRMPGAPLRADPASRFDLRWPSGERLIRQPFANHNGGNLLFGPDGYLYIGMGDGGSANDPQNNAQNPSTLLGKILRIDVNVSDGDPTGYRVPPDNPFLDGQPIQALAEIWAFGLRNPWRYSFDDFGPGATGALIIGDVGQNAREEVHYEPFGGGGRNYGWRLREGRIATPGVTPTTPAYAPLTEPIFDYERSAGQAVTGGYVYRGGALGTAYLGRYFFADYVSARVWSLALAINPVTGDATATNLVEHTGELGGNLGGIASFGRDLSGELYLLTFRGNVVKIVPGAAVAPAPPSSLTAAVSGSTVMLSWSAPPGTAVPGYQLEAGSSPGAANLAVFSVSGLQTSATFTGVPAGTYYVRIRGVGSGATSAPSNEVVVTVGGTSCALPAVPPTQFAASVNAGFVSLTWQLSSSSTATSVTIEAGSESGLANLAVITLPAAMREFTVQAPRGVYFARMRGVNVCGVSGPSNEIVVTVP